MHPCFPDDPAGQGGHGSVSQGCSISLPGFMVGLVLCFWAIGLSAADAPAKSGPQRLNATEVATNQAVAASHYVIAANDVVWLKVYQEDDLDTRVKVAGDGTISLPLLGIVQVAGKTIAEAGREIREALDKRFLVNPQVSFTVVEFSKRKFTVLGQVQRPGIYEYSGDERMTLLQALALAGGYTRMAAPSKVTVKRLEGGRVKTYPLKDEADPKNPTAVPFEIRPGDTINVGARIF